MPNPRERVRPSTHARRPSRRGAFGGLLVWILATPAFAAYPLAPGTSEPFADSFDCDAAPFWCGAEPAQVVPLNSTVTLYGRRVGTPTGDLLNVTSVVVKQSAGGSCAGCISQCYGTSPIVRLTKSDASVTISNSLTVGGITVPFNQKTFSKRDAATPITLKMNHWLSGQSADRPQVTIVETWDLANRSDPEKTCHHGLPGAQPFPTRRRAWCGHRAATVFGPVQQCYESHGAATDLVTYSPLTGGSTVRVGHLQLLDNVSHAFSSTATNGETGRFPFAGGPKASSIYGWVSYGEQRWASGFGPVLRWGNYNYVTQRFYPSGGWLPDLDG